MKKTLFAFCLLAASCSPDKEIATQVATFKNDFKRTSSQIRTLETSIIGQYNFSTKCLAKMKEDSGYYYYAYTDSLKRNIDSLMTQSVRGNKEASINKEAFLLFMGNWDKAHTKVDVVNLKLQTQKELDETDRRAIASADSLRQRLLPDLSRLRKVCAMQTYISKGACEAYDVALERTVLSKQKYGLDKSKLTPNKAK